MIPSRYRPIIPTTWPGCEIPLMLAPIEIAITVSNFMSFSLDCFKIMRGFGSTLLRYIVSKFAAYNLRDFFMPR